MFISHDIAADDEERFQVYMDHEPNGASVQSMLLYAQNMKEDRFQVWGPDYYHWDHLVQKRTTDLIPIETITKVPIAMFAAYDDTIADPIDAKWTKDTIGAAVIHYQMIEGGHLTFLIGKDMSYYTQDVMGLLHQYNPISTSFLQ